MKPKNIYLIRHGESEGNVDKSIYITKPDFSLNLTTKGHEQAFEAGFKLKALIGNISVRFYVSPFYRTRRTFDEIKPHFKDNHIEVREDPRLREHEWTTRLRADDKALEKKCALDISKFYYRFEHGESAADVYDGRMSTFLDSLHRDFEKPNFPENVVIVGHGMTNRIFLMRWFHWTPEQFEVVRNPENCQIYTLKRNDIGKYDLIEPLKKHKQKLSKY